MKRIIFLQKITWIRKIVLLLTFCTGFTGLVYEVTWQRYLANLLGCQARATALILSVFLGGLCLGYFIFGRFSKNLSPRNLLKTCGWAEVGIGAWVLFFPNFYALLWEKIGILDAGANFALLRDLAVCFALIAIPTTLMGGTLPLLTQGLSKDLKDAPTFHAKVYATNTGGAFLGCLIAGFWFIPLWGLPLTLTYMGLANLFCGFSMVGLAAALSSKLPDEKAREKSTPVKNRLAMNKAALVAGLAGFYSLSLQTVFMRVIGKVIGSSEYAFCLVVAVYIFMLALGATYLSRSQQKPSSLGLNQLFVLIGISLLFFLVPYWPYLFHVIRVLFTNLPVNFYVYYFVVFLALGIFLAIPVGAMGRTMPMLFGAVKSPMRALGTDIGVLYGWNTVGCMLGALFGGYMLLYYFNLDQLIKICLLAIWLSLPLVFPLRKKSLAPYLIGLILLLGIPLMPPWSAKKMGIGLFRLQQATAWSFAGQKKMLEHFVNKIHILAYRDGPNTSVTIAEQSLEQANPYNPPVNRVIYVNGKPDGGTQGEDLKTTRLLAHLPALFQTSASGKAAVVGFGTGITVGSLTLYPNINQIDVIEISPAVKDFAGYFDSSNHAASTHPKVKWQMGDAYRILGSSQEKYAMIVSEPSNPWVSGVERLYSQEFYNLVLSKLQDQGIYSQWFHLYSMSEQTVGMVINTFASTFPNVYLFGMPGGSDLILLGAKRSLGDSAWAQLETQRRLPEIDQELQGIGIHSTASLMAHELWLSPSSFRQAGFHLLEFPKLSFLAGKDFFLGSRIDLAKYQNHPDLRPALSAFSTQTLTYLWRMRKKPQSFEDLKDFAKNACQTAKTEFFPSWDEKPLPCSQSLVALAVAKIISPAYGFTQKNLQLLEALQDSSNRSLASASSIADAEEAIRLFSLHASIFLPLSPEKLRKYSQICFQEKDAAHTQCRSQWVQALTWAGQTERAQVEYNQLLREAPEFLPANIQNSLRQMLEESAIASQPKTQAFRER